ncbi:biotin-dependent carboxyltransferase family protein [bacterium]|nr:biotin-dependent carboxyltransferase family protein [bacterium]MCI0605185.1 biotin-dependent carboxyltransferase family protein [bacterium]
MIEVVQPGMLTTIQDSGRKGFEAYGVPVSGPFDPFLAAMANRLCGNPLDAPVFEFAMIGPTLHFHEKRIVALCGLSVQYELQGQTVPLLTSTEVPAESVLKFVSMEGWYGYLAIAGGIETESVLSSVSTYLAGGIGKRLEKGQMLKTGPEPGGGSALRSVSWSYPLEPVLYLLPAQHSSHFSARERQKIREHNYKISPQSNRMGIRLEGAAIDPPVIRRSAPALTGTVQIPRSGFPIILGPEGPTTGGYAQMGVISRASWTLLAGKRPGSAIRFEWTDPETARHWWNDRQDLLRASL